MPSYDLDDLDRAIVRILQDDARRTNRSVADELHSSEPTVRRRVERLIDMGLIKIVAVVSPFALGYGVVAILGVQFDRAYQTQIEQALQTMPEVRFVGLTLGSFDAMLEVWLPSNDALLDFLHQRLGAVVGITRVETWQVVKLSKYSYDWGEQPSTRL